MKKTIGNLFHDMVLSAKNLLTRKKEETNNMNVFPVPDGDTGINMSLTMSGVSNVEEDLSLGQSAEETANQMLRSARGNSGAILSLFFRGVGKAFRELKEANALAWVKAFEAGTKEAYRAVMRTLFASVSDLAILPIQDVLGFGADTRMNIPGEPSGNWRYRVTSAQLSAIDKAYFRKLNRLYGR